MLRIEEFDFIESNGRPQPSKVLLDFLNSDKECIEILYGDSYIDGHSCANSFRNAVNALRLNGTICVNRRTERVFVTRSSSAHALDDALGNASIRIRYFNWKKIMDEFSQSGLAYRELKTPFGVSNRIASNTSSSAKTYLRRHGAYQDLKTMVVNKHVYLINSKKISEIVEEHGILYRDERSLWKSIINWSQPEI